MTLKLVFKILIFSFLAAEVCPIFAQFDGYYDKDDYQGLDSLYIYFNPQNEAINRDKETLTMLHKVADFLLQNPAFRVRLDGHTAPDEMTSENAHQILGIKRANKVRQFLEAKGIPKCKIKIETFGSAEPIFSDSIPQLPENQQKHTLPNNQSMEKYYKEKHIKTPKKLRKQIKQYETQEHESTHHSTKSVKTNRRVECHFYLNENQNVTMDFMPSDTLEIADTIHHQMVFGHNSITPNNIEIALNIAQKALEKNPHINIIICRFDSISPQLEDRMTYLIDSFTSRLTKKPIYFSLFPCNEWKIFIGLYDAQCRKEESE